MGRVVTVREMRRAEENARAIGMNEDIMIESAASGMMHVLEKHIKKNDLTAVFVGGGNNGADGLSLSRMLHLNGYRTEAVTVGEKRGEYNAARLKAYRALGGKVVDLDTAAARIDCYKTIVDAVFGIGLTRAPVGDSLRAIRLMNGADAYRVATDIPSGLFADDGKVVGEAFKAALTVTFGAYKYGHFLGDGADYCGEIALVDVGIPTLEGAWLADANTPRLAGRKRVGHKGDYGRVAVIGGSAEMTGAPLLAAESALSSGAGLVKLCAAESLKDAYTSRVREATLSFAPDRDGFIRYDEAWLSEIMAFADSIVIGMGMGANPELKDIIACLAANFDGTLVVDADGLNALVGRLGSLKGHKCRLVLTPHRGEFFRLFGKCDEKDLAERSKSAALETNAVIVNKSNTTVITDGKETYINASGSPSMAKGGSGDTLAGAVAAFAVRMGALNGAAHACYECGRAGERAAASLGEDAPTASDTIGFLSRTRK